MKIPKFKSNKNFRKGGFRTNPDVAWEIVLYVAFAGILAFFIFSFYLFREINREFISSSSNTNEAKTVNKERLNKVLDYFNNREKRSNEILNSPSPIVDPSI